MTDDEQKLIQAARGGDQEAFALLIRRVEGRLFRMIYRSLGSEEDARDVLQEVFIKVHRSLGKFRSDSSFYTWIYRIAVRTCSEKIRSGSFKIKQASEPLEVTGGEGLLERARREFTARQKSVRQEIEEEEKVVRIRKAIASLPRKYFEVVVLHDLEELSYEEAAKILRIPKGTMMSRLHRAHLRLVKKLKDEGIQP